MPKLHTHLTRTVDRMVSPLVYLMHITTRGKATIREHSNIECKSAIKRQRQEESIANAIQSWSVPAGVAPYNDDILEDLKAKHPFKPAPFLSHISIDHHYLIASPTMVLDRITIFPRGTSCRRDGLCAQHLMDYLSGAVVASFDELVSSITQVVNLFLDGNCPKILGEYIASAPLIPLVKLGGGIRPIAIDTIWRRLVSKVIVVLIGHSLDGYFNDLQFGVGVSGGGKTILHAMNHLIEGRRDDVGLSMLLVDLKNAFNLVDQEVMLEEHTLWSCQWVQQGDLLGPLLFYLVLHLLICKIKDSFSLSLHVWYLDNGTIIGDTLVVGEVLELIMKDGPCCGLHLNVDKTEVFWPKEDPKSRLAGVFPPNIARPLHGVKLLGGPTIMNFNFNTELVMKRVAKTIKCLRWPNVLLMWLFVVPGAYCDVLNYAFLTSRLQSASLQTKLLRHSSIVASRPTFTDALCAFYTKMETGLLSNASEIAAPKLMKKLADKYFTCVTQTAESTFSLSSRQMALCPLIFCFEVVLNLLQSFYRRYYGDHVVSRVSIISIKHRHNVVRDTLVDICFRLGILVGKEVDIGLGGGCDKPLRPTNMMVDFVPGRAVIDATHRKRVKYEAKCANIGYGFLPFSFSSLGELEKDAVNLLKRIRSFS
ncbi:hypothetical protein Tco_0678847 [Tanacetum coccineum]|uniref:Reverse transcriptase domain-containing protein n=1 Tax=Tanacetum coccineum TaxID=301880 RepID=A0ABQ4XH67_9ASTR